MTDISDHLPIFAFTGQKHVTKAKGVKISYRKMSNTAKENIKTDLRNVNWAFIDQMPANEAYETFNNRLQSIIDLHAPVKMINASSKKLKRNPWMTSGLVKSSLKLDKLYRKKLKYPKTHNSHKTYLTYRNIFNKLKRTAKKMYYEQLLKKYEKDMKRTWAVLNSLIGKHNDKSNSVQHFKINDTLEKQPKRIANHFCQYFNNVGPTIEQSIPPANYTPDHYLKNKVDANIFFAPTDPFEVSNLISGLNNKPSSGHDGIALSTLKTLNNELKEPIAMLVNKSLYEGHMPDTLKRAKVLPIYKSKDKQLVENYRPISILPSISKVFEKVVFKRVYNFLDHHSVFHNSQYGFRPNHSTIDAITEFTQNIFQSLENNNYSIGVFLDMSKAFDTLNLDILFEKLNWYGIRGKALDWFKSYLCNRKQYVSFAGCCSSDHPISHGVPQGSILGPLLFLIYINDLPNALTYTKPILFADDSNLFASSPDINILTRNINIDLQSLSEWCKTNRLSLNTDKTFYIVFHKKSQKVPNNITLQIYGKNITAKQTTKFLGMTIDSLLNWHNHIGTIVNRLRSSNYILNRLKHLLPITSLKSLYYSLVHPHITYGIIHWGNAPKTMLNKVIIQQKKSLRIINGRNYNTPTNPLFHKMKILKIQEIYELQLATFMYKYSTYNLPTQLQQLFILNRQLHNYNTRNRNNPIVPMHKTDMGKRSIAHMGPLIWNAVPNNIKLSNTCKSFKSKLKNNLLERYN